MAEENKIPILEGAVHIDVNLIPEWQKERLAAATLEFYKRILKMPNGREILDAKKRELGLM